MLVFSNEKLVMLAMPKTGSVAYEYALGPRATMVVRNPPELKHAPVFRYNRFFRPALEKFCGEGFDLVAVMREPLDWLGSWYRYRQRPEMAGTPTSTCEVNFDTFVLAYLKGDRPEFARVGSQAKFLEPQKNGTAVTHLFRYEDQEGLQTFLQDRLGFTFETRRMNDSPKAALSLSADTEKRYRRKFAVEYQLYSGIGPGGTYVPLPQGAAMPHG